MRLGQSLKQKKMLIIFGDYTTKKSKGDCYYTNYIKKVFTENGVLMTRPQIDKYVSIFVKNDDDFNAFKAELQNTGYKNMPSKMRSDVRKYNHQVENQSKE